MSFFQRLTLRESLDIRGRRTAARIYMRRGLRALRQKACEKNVVLSRALCTLLGMDKAPFLSCQKVAKKGSRYYNE